eukprot:UN23047
MASNMNKQRKAGKCTDVDLVLNDDSILHCHSVVLRQSKYFSNVLDKRESNGVLTTPCTIVLDANQTVMNTILDYLYTGVCEITQSHFKMFELSCLFRIEGLQKQCVDKVCNSITAANCIKIAELVCNKFPKQPACVVVKNLLLDNFLNRQSFLENLCTTHQLTFQNAPLEILEILCQKIGFNFRTHPTLVETLFNTVSKFVCKNVVKADNNQNIIATTIDYLSALPQSIIDHPEFRKSPITLELSREQLLREYRVDLNVRNHQYVIAFREVKDEKHDSWIEVRFEKQRTLNTNDADFDWFEVAGFSYTFIDECSVTSQIEKRHILSGRDVTEGFSEKSY